MFNYIPALLNLKLLQLKTDRRGVTALEYGLIAGLIAVVIIGALGTLGTSLTGIFTMISGKLDAVK